MEKIILIVGVIGVITFLYLITQLRKVVPTNEVHIVQSSKKSIPYGRSISGSRNAYLAWPTWVPLVGVEVQKLPISVFDLQLSGYKAYDLGKVPFQVDVTAFFIVEDAVLAAEKVFDIQELKDQLNETLKGVVRKTLASRDIIEIMDSRKEIKDEFFIEVFEAVKVWGVKLTNVEFMDIRDAEDSKVITNIMMKKRSQIEAESQIEVAENQKKALIEKENKAAEARAKAAEAKSRADILESDALKESEVRKIENEKITKEKSIENQKILYVQEEESKQKVYESQKITKEKELEVKKVEETQTASIEKEKAIIKAQEEKEKAIIQANGEKQTIELAATAEKNRIESIGLAKAKEIDYIGTAEAKNKKQMAESLNLFTNSSIKYMEKELDVKLSEIVDLEKAKALSKADIKVISTGENGGNGVQNFMDLLSVKGGAQLGGMIEGIQNVIGKDILPNKENNNIFKKEENKEKQQKNVVKKIS